MPVLSTQIGTALTAPLYARFHCRVTSITSVKYFINF